jgi:hypothetical protein
VDEFVLCLLLEPAALPQARSRFMASGHLIFFPVPLVYFRWVEGTTLIQGPPNRRVP